MNPNEVMEHNKKLEEKEKKIQRKIKFYQRRSDNAYSLKNDDDIRERRISSVESLNFESVRLATFYYFKHKNTQNIQILAKKGFYYDRMRDLVVCFFCYAEIRSKDGVYLELPYHRNFWNNEPIDIKQASRYSIGFDVPEEEEEEENDGKGNDGELLNQAGGDNENENIPIPPKIIEKCPMAQHPINGNIPIIDPEIVPEVVQQIVPEIDPEMDVEIIPEIVIEIYPEFYREIIPEIVPPLNPPINRPINPPLNPKDSLPRLYRSMQNLMTQNLPLVPKKNLKDFNIWRGEGLGRDKMYDSYEERLSTFNYWFVYLPENERPRKEDYATAGFVHSGFSDFVVCVYCKGGLFNLHKDDDPVSDHYNLYGNCNFIREYCLNFQANFIFTPKTKIKDRITPESIKKIIMSHPMIKTLIIDGHEPNLVKRWILNYVRLRNCFPSNLYLCRLSLEEKIDEIAKEKSEKKRKRN